MKVSSLRSAGGASWGPIIRRGIISSTSVKIATPTPDDHFSARPDCGVIFAALRRISDASSCPTVRNWVVLTARIQIIETTKTAPYNHDFAGPNGGVMIPFGGRVNRADRRPAIGLGIVFGPSIQVGSASPDNHFIASPNRSM